jgi:phenylacetate-CoA ligase
MLKYKGTKVYPKAIENAIACVNGVGNYVIEAFTGDNLSDKIIVKVGCKKKRDSLRQILRTHIEAHARVTPIVELVSMQEVESLQSDNGKSRKLKAFIDHRIREHREGMK